MVYEDEPRRRSRRPASIEEEQLVLLQRFVDDFHGLVMVAYIVLGLTLFSSVIFLIAAVASSG